MALHLALQNSKGCRLSPTCASPVEAASGQTVVTFLPSDADSDISFVSYHAGG